MPYCRECGVETTPDQTYCSNCGTHLDGKVDAADDDDPTPAEPVSTDTARETMFYVGAVLGVLAVIFVPFVFVFVALPESIYWMRGGSI